MAGTKFVSSPLNAPGKTVASKGTGSPSGVIISNVNLPGPKASQPGSIPKSRTGQQYLAGSPLDKKK